MYSIPIMRPRLPSADRLAPYLKSNNLLDEITRGPTPVGAIMPVMPFGFPLDIALWEAFESRTGLAVVIDAAAAFDSLARSTLAVPFYRDITAPEISRITEVVLPAAHAD